MARARRVRAPLEAGELPIAPMIDVVFLLLIYFMVSSTIQKQEADLAFALPATVPSSKAIEFPDEQIVELDALGQVSVNGYALDSPESPRFRELAALLARYRQASEAIQASARVSIAPSDATPHEMVVKVLDACALAGVSGVSFAVE